MTTDTTTPELGKGQILAVRYETKKGECSFDSAVRDVRGDRVHILPPREASRELYAGKQIEVLAQIEDVAYRFISQILTLDGDCVIARPSDMRPVEKRQHYRLQIGLVPSYGAVTDNNGVDDRSTRLTVVDISAGGVQFVSRNAFAPGTRVHMWLPIEDYRVDCVVEVIHARTPAKGRSNFRYNGRFSSISTEDQEHVARFVFRKQLELRRRA